MKKLILLCAALLCVPAWGGAADIQAKQLVGTWLCDSEHEWDENFKMAERFRWRVAEDGRFWSVSENITLKEKKENGGAIDYRTMSKGKWSLKDNVLSEDEQLLVFQRILPQKPLADDMKVIDGMLILAMNNRIKKKTIEKFKSRVQMPEPDVLLLHELEDNIQTRCVRIKS